MQRLAFAQSNIPEAYSNSLTDSLKGILSTPPKLDSTIGDFNGAVDSLKKNICAQKLHFIGVQNQYSKLSWRKKNIDTLPEHSSRWIHQLDSTISKGKSGIDSLLQRNNVTDNKLPFNLSAATEKIPNSEITTIQTKFPTAGINKNFHIPQLKIDVKLPENWIPRPNDINEHQILDRVEDAPENLFKKIEGVKKVESSKGKIESLVNQAEEYSKGLEDGKAFNLTVKKEFIDYLQTKESIIKKDLEDIAKLQTKYRDIADSRLLPKQKWKSNAMKGKPFIERIIPGLDLQVFTGAAIAVNVAPSISYKLTGTFQSGLSIFKRLTYFKKEESLRFGDSHGFRFFTQVKIFKSVNFFGELERFKPDSDSQAILHSKIARQVDDDFTTKVNLGLMNNYPLGKNIRGYFVVLYDVLQIKKFPNSVGSSARFGFQYPLKAKKK